ncbi:hypothetical protein GGI13_005023 [Coemansia sp. RSA 455]|nr:hypothetical protein GGI14_000473 [Coemansia sp. S680]KAJ2051254.1 hypothetical protein H4S04_002100 [Coemansia sp. S16]KAJ2077466.1 hypothetical protein GGI16_008121 [Coemansia sp. S142-1]KAJ2247484.1 hypothetical protein GGI13_005023 [Coemansia sp. RSA 455]KAJ2459666.1 hypothetical protein GGI03_005488 [Coemansia sp. RSA 2337]
MLFRANSASLRGQSFLLICCLAVLALVGIVGMYSFDYGYFAPTNSPAKDSTKGSTSDSTKGSTSGSTGGGLMSTDEPSVRSSFDSYLQKLHRGMHKEDLQAYCSQDKFSETFVTSVKQRYADITPDNMEPMFIAINLHNNEQILPNMATQLLALADTLGHDRIFISIYENGSEDKTKEILKRFDETLDALNIAHRILTDPTPKPKQVHRIEYLAKVRNSAMEPLYSSKVKYGKVLFSNDVYFCLTDVLELLFQSRVQGAHLTCAEDFIEVRGKPAFYDTWVARDIEGKRMRDDPFHISDDEMSVTAQMRDRPFQVQCGWNGMVVIDAEAFRGDNGLRFRRNVKGECSASECSLFCNDLWRKGFNRIINVPRVKLTYDFKVRNLLRRPENFPADMPYNPPEVEKISFRPGPKTVYCRPLKNPITDIQDDPDEWVKL